jgi:3-deoxy-D-manno-octulosonic acid kinase
LSAGALVRVAFGGAAGSGAMLADARDPGKPVAPWFDPQFWIARNAVVAEARGRGQTWVVKEGQRHLVLRHYRRGGLIAKLSHDRYLWLGEERTRAFRELALLARMRDAGLPVPRPVAARYLRHGRTWSGDLLIEFIPQTQTLAQRLSSGTVSLQTWGAVGRMLQGFHAAGVCHTDLNAHNVLLRGPSECWLIDFDGASVRAPGLWRDANLVRLRRSLEKLNDGPAAGRFDEPQWHCLLGAYRGSARAMR